MEAELTALAVSGATTMVTLMVSDAWAQARGRLARLFSRGAGDDDTGRLVDELQASREELLAARAAGDDEGAADIEEQWRLRIRRMLRADPAAAQELRELLDDVGAPAGGVRNELSGVVHGPSVQAAQIHGGITFHVQPPPLPGRDVKPDEVPPLAVDFVNRTKDIAALDEWFGAQRSDALATVRLGLVYGMRGVGKTSMVCHWAERGRDLFPDGQIYVDFAPLGGLAGGGDVSDAVRTCLISIGVDESAIPQSTDARIARFRTHSAGRRMLVVLDNVSHPAQVRSLIPKGRGSVLLATSNARLGELAMAGAKLLPLEPLDRDGGLHLLAGACGAEAVDAERPAAERLVELCGGLPVALSVLTARLVTTQGLTMTRLARELAEEPDPLAGMALGSALSVGEERSVAAVFDLTYRELPPEAARMYRLLSLLPGRTFDAGTAAVAADTTTAAARAWLTALEELRLLDVEPKDGRYRFHALVRLHARRCAALEEAEGAQLAVVQRVLTHYLALTAFADRAIRQDRLRVAELGTLLRDAPDPFAGDDGPAPLDWLEAEHHNILDMLRAAARHGLADRLWPLAEAYTVLFLHHRHLAPWKESLELGAEAAAACMEPAAEARLRSLLSRPLMDLGEYDAARAQLEAAVACAEVSGHAKVRASVQEFLGRYWEHFDLDRALAAYRRSIELNTGAQEWRGAAIASYFLGCAQDARGEHALALDTLSGAHRALLDCDDARMAARATIALAFTHDHLGDTDRAIEALTEAAAALRQQQADHYEAQALVALAGIEERTGLDPTAVRAHLTRALEIYESRGNPEAPALRERLAGLDEAG
ncbi:NB-ARC domain-containing protein [Streptomyces sp. NPDC048696]|uniref:NB-ARC domain-containing protein n=1 Tax=Streptomyces sp. NPDC048696 TaxID=3365585 RepID=UPI00372434CB